jgi:lysozyme|uniref:lysozyme n=1 Tax=Siphoviridae sp. ctGuJ10 TaxID=2825418 RepID=A0A8S5PUF7_9CAUD|nr:MAG TPA: PlyB like endolysin [Siphoviridae sp. ctGuJ10]
MKEYGLDLSKHNGTLDFNEIKKEGNSFVILRAGYGKLISQKDIKFEEYYKKAKSVGLKVGTYWYSYATTPSEAITEAKCFYDVIKGKQFEYPVFFDIENKDHHKGASKNDLVKMCKNFCDFMESKGYYAGVYANTDWFTNYISELPRGRYDEWEANYGSNDGTLQNVKLRRAPRIHQFTSNYKIGVKRFDRNISYYDYASVIKDKGLNGFSKQQTSNNEEISKKDENVSTVLKHKVGDVVSINGVYSSSDSAEKLNPYTKKGKITKIIASARNPYLLEDGNIGWVNDSCIVTQSSNALKVGSRVKIKSSAKNYATGEKIPDWVKKQTHTIQKISDEKVLLKEIASWVYKKDVE